MHALSAETQLAILRAMDAVADQDLTPAPLLDALNAALAPFFAGAEAYVLMVQHACVERGLPRQFEGRSAVAHDGAGRLADDVLRTLADDEPTEAWVRAPDVGLLPLVLHGRVLGALLVVRTGGITQQDEAAAACAAERIDSALAHCCDREALLTRTQELEAIYTIDSVRDLALPFEDMLSEVLEKLLELVGADMAMVGLRHVLAQGGQTVFHRRVRLGAHDAEAWASTHDDVLRSLVESTFADATLHREAAVAGSGRHALAMPLVLESELIGALVMFSKPGAAFTERQERVFEAVCSQADTAIFEDLARKKLKDVFRRYVSADVFTEILSHDEDFLRGRRREVTCLFSDLRGFTAVSERLDVDIVVQLLNEHLDAMTDVVFEHGGTVDKFIGDCVMAFFGAPIDQPDHAARALRCADAMRARHEALCADWQRRGLPVVKIGIGLHAGEVFVGHIGGMRQSSYTVIGDHVNLASRLEGVAGPDEVIFTQQTLDLAQPYLSAPPALESRGSMVAKGKTESVDIFNLVRAPA